MYYAGNRLLAALSSATRQRLLDVSTFRQLSVGTVLYKPEERVQYVYFLTSGIASVVLPMADGQVVELLLIGPEGLTGGHQLAGPASLQASCFIQLKATGYRVRLEQLQSLLHDCEELQFRIREFLQHGFMTLAQIAGCNCLHRTEQRLARWLLMAQDRACTAELPFTQEFLAQMLGVQRTTVNVLAGSLADAGLIQYSRGKVTIVDRVGLQNAACSCFAVVHRLHETLYQMPFPLRTM